MEKIEIILDNYSQEAKNAALDAALEIQNHILIDVVLKLKPDFAVGGERLLEYAITNCDFTLLRKLLRLPEIGKNKKVLKEGLCSAASFTASKWDEFITVIIEEKASEETVNVALEVLLDSENLSAELIVKFIKLGAKVYIDSMHLERNQFVVEQLFLLGLGKSIELSNVARQTFCHTICRKGKINVVKCVIRDQPDLVGQMTEIAVTGGYSRIVKLLHQEKAITTVDEELFVKAIRENHYLTVKYIAESGIRKLELTDVINAAAFSTVRLMLFLVGQLKEQEGDVVTDKFNSVIKVACIYNRTDSVVALLEAGYECDFNANIKQAASKGYLRMVYILLQYAKTINNTSFDEAIKLAELNKHTETVKRMQAYRRNNPNKFQ